jgi:hypothetical protein
MHQGFKGELWRDKLAAQYRVLGNAVKFWQMTTEAADVESAVAISSISTSSAVELR